MNLRKKPDAQNQVLNNSMDEVFLFKKGESEDKGPKQIRGS